MKVSNQVIPKIIEMPSVETLVGNKEQEYPKPSIPPENKEYTEIEKSKDISVDTIKTEKNKLKIEENINPEDHLKILREINGDLNKKRGYQIYFESN